MEFGLLGGLSATADGVLLTPSRPKERALLAYLLLHVGQVRSGDELVEVVWGERPPATARSALHGHISRLRRVLGPERIETLPSGYRLRLLDVDRIDVQRFEELIDAAQVAAPAARSAALRSALAVFRGPPLAEFQFEAFAANEIARLEELRISAVERWVEAELELGHHLAVIPQLEQLVADHPLREAFREQLMLALYRSGRQADALRVAAQARRYLADELGIDPGPALLRLEQSILNHDPHLLAPVLAATVAEPPPAVKPAGIVTFLVARFVAASDGDGTAEAAAGSAAAQQELVRTVTRAVGYEVDARGGEIQIAFARAREAAASAAAVERAARVTGDRVRIGIHSTEVVPTDDGYTGPGLGKASHICRAAHPGQILLSQSTRDLLQEAPLDLGTARDLGEHRLADLERRQTVFQLVPPGSSGDFPPLAGLEGLATNLPIQPTALIGRTLEVREVADIVSGSGVRLVTLTGPGGTGKTRLAVHAAAELLADFTDGVFLIDLAPLRDPDLVIPTIARTLGLDDASGGPAEALGAYLRRRQVLLVLDNVEHVRAAGPAIATMLEGAPRLKVLATSRGALDLEGERTYVVSPLGLPRRSAGVDRIVEADSVALFTSLAVAVRPGVAVSPDNADAVAGICRVLDGLPLAIELAAARIGLLAPGDLLTRIGEHRDVILTRTRDAPHRHRTLEATISWSYDLLEPDQQALFRRLGVFAGGCSLEAAERVCGEDVEVIGGLAALVDASLLRLEGTDLAPRFVLLETIRKEAARRLERSAEADELHQRHAAHFTALAELAEPHLRGSPGEWADRLELDHDNLRAALDRLATDGAPGESLRLSGALWRFWYLKSHLAEGGRYLESALARDPRPTPARGKALIGAAVMAVNTGDFTTALRRAEEGIELHQALGDPWGDAYCRFMLGAAAQFSGDPARARPLYESSVRAFRELGDEHSALLVSRNLAAIYIQVGDRAQGQALLEDNLRRARATNNSRIEASTLGSMAALACEAGRLQDAGWMLKESLRIHRELGDRLDTFLDLSRAAQVLVLSGKAGIAVRLVASFVASGEESGTRQLAIEELNTLTIASARRQLEPPTFAEAWRQGQAISIHEAVVLALDAIG